MAKKTSTKAKKLRMKVTDLRTLTGAAVKGGVKKNTKA